MAAAAGACAQSVVSRLSECAAFLGPGFEDLEAARTWLEPAPNRDEPDLTHLLSGNRLFGVTRKAVRESRAAVEAVAALLMDFDRHYPDEIASIIAGRSCSAFVAGRDALIVWGR
jgi:hypothetical protein